VAVGAEVAALEARMAAKHAERDPRKSRGRRARARARSPSSSAASATPSASSAEDQQSSGGSSVDRARRVRAREMARAEERAADPKALLRRAHKAQASARLFHWETSRRDPLCAPEYLPQVFGMGNTAMEHARTTLMSRKLETSHEADSYLLAASALDELASESSSSLFTSATVELLCRRLFAFEEATKEVRGLDHLKKVRAEVDAVFKSIDIVPGVGVGVQCETFTKSTAKKLRQGAAYAAARGRAAAAN